MSNKLNTFDDIITQYNYDDLYNYYIKELHSFVECKKYLNVSQTTLQKVFNYYNIVKSQEDIKKTYTRNKFINTWSDELKDSFKKDYLKNELTVKEFISKYDLKNKKMFYDIIKDLKLEERKSSYFKKSLDDVLKEFNLDYDNNVEVSKSLSIKELANKFNASQKTIIKLINTLDLPRDNLLNFKRCQTTKLEKYGNTGYNNVDKIKETNLERYGVAHFVNRAKMYQTKLERYNNPNYNNREKFKQTNRLRYGKEYYTNPDKREQTCLDKYGVRNASQSIDVRNKISQSQLAIGNKKGYLTKKKNNSFNTSKIEETTLTKLSYIFSNDELFSQYKEDRYPYACDFYIKPLDMFIELNITWTHGNKLFDLTNANDINKMLEWNKKAKTSKYYKQALYVWTDLDIRKMCTAVENKLNYVTLYNKEDVQKWLKGIYDTTPKLFGLSKKDVLTICKNNKFPGTKKWSSNHPIWDCYLPNHLSPKQAWRDDTLLSKAIDNLFKVLKNCILQDKEPNFVLKHKRAFENINENPQELLELVLNRFTIAKIAPKVTAINERDVLKIIENSNIDISKGVYCPMAGFGGIIRAVQKWYDVRNISDAKIYAADINENFCRWYGWEQRDVLSQKVKTNLTVIVCPPFGEKYEHWDGTPNDMSNISFVDWYKLIKEYIDAPNYIIIGPELKSKNKIGLFSKTIGVQRWTDDMIKD